MGGGLLAGILAPGVVHACACGCGVFDVGTSSMLPDGQGGMAFLQYDYQDQNRNWSGTSQAPSGNNDDKEIETDFVTLGLQYLFNDKWGAQLELPYDYRRFRTDVGGGDIESRNWSQFGDLRLEGIYTGFFADQSVGVTFGVKLPTGSYSRNADIVDRDTQIGTGSTDLLLGGFYRGNITQDEKWDWFAQGVLDVPVLTQADIDRASNWIRRRGLISRDGPSAGCEFRQWRRQSFQSARVIAVPTPARTTAGISG